jgi:hypothetical protein
MNMIPDPMGDYSPAELMQAVCALRCFALTLLFPQMIATIRKIEDLKKRAGAVPTHLQEASLYGPAVEPVSRVHFLHALTPIIFPD